MKRRRKGGQSGRESRSEATTAPKRAQLRRWRLLALMGPVMLLALAAVTGIAAWNLFSRARAIPPNPLATYYRIDGVGVLVDRAGVKAKFGVGCAPGEPYFRTSYCMVALRFGPGTPPGTHWAIALSAKLRLLGRGRTLRGLSEKNRTRENEFFSFPNGPWPVWVREHYAIIGDLTPYPIAAGGNVIVGSVGKRETRSSWHIRPEYIPEAEELLDFQPQIAFFVLAPEDLVASENGVTVGSVPHIGIPLRLRFYLRGQRSEPWWPRRFTWRTPNVRYYASAESPVVTHPLLGNLATRPKTPSGELKWSSEKPFQPIWTYTEPSLASDTRRDLFISGALISLAGAFLVAFVQALFGIGLRKDQTRWNRLRRRSA